MFQTGRINPLFPESSHLRVTNTDEIKRYYNGYYIIDIIDIATIDILWTIKLELKKIAVILSYLVLG